MPETKLHFGYGPDDYDVRTLCGHHTRGWYRQSSWGYMINVRTDNPETYLRTGNTCRRCLWRYLKARRRADRSLPRMTDDLAYLMEPRTKKKQKPKPKIDRSCWLELTKQKQVTMPPSDKTHWIEL